MSFVKSILSKPKPIPDTYIVSDKYGRYRVGAQEETWNTNKVMGWDPGANCFYLARQQYTDDKIDTGSNLIRTEYIWFGRLPPKSTYDRTEVVAFPNWEVLQVQE